MAASVGDSRAVLASLSDIAPPEVSRSSTSGKKRYSRKISAKGKPLEAIALTVDQKPNHEEEMERIKQFGGRVGRLVDEAGNRIGPYRVWRKHGNLPGIAMSRSLGDKMASQLGVIPTPIIQEFDLAPGTDQFIVAGSDGVWYVLLRDVMTNEEVVQFVEMFRSRCSTSPNQHANPVTATRVTIAHLLCEEARYRWFGVVEEEDVMVDDISCLVLQLHFPNVAEKPMFGERISRMVNVSVVLEESQEESISRVRIVDPVRNSVSPTDEDRRVHKNVVRRDLRRGSIAIQEDTDEV